MGFFQLIIKSIFAFVIVNIDEFLVLLLFFTKAIADHHSNHDHHHQADDQLTVFQIIAGQIIGFTIIIGISLFGSLFGLFIPYRYISLIGFVPLVLGCIELSKVLRFWWKKCCTKKSRITSASYASPPAVSTVPTSPTPLSHLPGTDSISLEENLVKGQDGRPTTKLSTSNSNHDRRTSFNTNSDFELQYETISSLNPLSSNASHRLSYYPPRHDYSSYQNPPFTSSTDYEKDEKTGLLLYSSDDEIEQGRSSTSSEDNEESETEIEETPLTHWFQEHYQSAFHKNIFYVSMILLGDGSEEIAVFLPILSTAMSSEQGIMSFSSTSSSPSASSSSSSPTVLMFYHIFIVLLIIFIWYLMIFCQCYLAYLLIVYHYESYGKWISRYSKNIIPLVLIGLGCLILKESILMNWMEIILRYCQQQLIHT
jgi:cadmium resistance protein CadD (predicted permease)